mmetsp:Transcript_119653/g.290395  ORF Transcript_119653/g.290395 Transcript_119653/m.290395 type:complete len:143 (-) Transcript_119653:113-541(-)
MVIKTQLCAFSERRIYPGHGTMAVRRDGQAFYLASKKATSMYNQKKKPQKIAWTLAWRRLHKKTQDRAGKKKRTRRAIKFQRAIAGMKLDDIRKKRNEKPEKRDAQRKLNLEEIKKRKKAAKKARKAAGGNRGRQYKPAQRR